MFQGLEVSNDGAPWDGVSHDDVPQDGVSHDGELCGDVLEHGVHEQILLQVLVQLIFCDENELYEVHGDALYVGHDDALCDVHESCDALEDGVHVQVLPLVLVQLIFCDDDVLYGALCGVQHDAHGACALCDEERGACGGVQDQLLVLDLQIFYDDGVFYGVHDDALYGVLYVAHDDVLYGALCDD